MLSDDLARPTFAPFDVEAEYVWIDCDLKNYEGFKVEVRMNLRNKERKRMNIAIDDINAERERISANVLKRSKELDKKIAAVRDKGTEKAIEAASEEKFAFLESTATAYDENVAKVHKLICPYIRAWNVVERDEAGELVDAPPPMTVGLEAFDAIDQQMTWWLVKTIQSAYRGGKGFSGSSNKPDAPVVPASESTEITSNDEPQDNPNESDQPSAENSPSPSASTSTD